MRVIRSSSNPRIQRIKKLFKSRKQPFFLVEGRKQMQEAIHSQIRFDEVFLTPEIWAGERSWLQPLEEQGTEFSLIAPAVLRSISDVKTPQGILGIARRPSLRQKDVLTGFALLLISIRDPGNFGTIVRTAEACGCEWIAYSSDCVDPFQPKTIRASMGSIFRMPVIRISDVHSFLKSQKEKKIFVYGLTNHKAISVFDWKPEYPFIVCIGSESHGLPADLCWTDQIHIPMKGQVESLNAAVAAAVCMYQISSKQ
jgi:TrmH family RNA methyltransferase